MKKPGEVIFICPSCFRVCNHAGTCHGREMIDCFVGEPGSSLRRPVADRSGRLVSRAPRWFVEAVGWIAAGPHYTPFH